MDRCPSRRATFQRRVLPRLHVISLTWLLALLCGAPLAEAQASSASAETPEYRAAVERGLEEYQLGNFQEARDQFARAHALHPNARTLRGLGFAAFELRNYVDAESLLEAALASREKPLEGKLRAEAEQMLERAKSYVGSVTLELAPATAVVSIDGIRRTQEGDHLRLDVGDHVLEFRAEGFLAERRAIRVQGGKEQTLHVALARLEAGSSTGERDSGAPAKAAPLYKRWWLWTIVGVVVAGAAAGTAIALTSKKTTEYRGVPSDNTPDGAGIAALRMR